MYGSEKSFMISLTWQNVICQILIIVLQLYHEHNAFINDNVTDGDITLNIFLYIV